MILLLDTSSPTALLRLVGASVRQEYSWNAERELAKGLLSWLEACLKENQLSFNDVEAIGMYKGPGSFTGLRIGMAVANSLSNSLAIPIVSETGDDWQSGCLVRIQNGETDGVALPRYDRDANITKPRK